MPFAAERWFCMFMRFLLNLALLLTAGGIYAATDVNSAVKDYVSFFSVNSSGSLENFKNCFVPEERSNIFTLPSIREKRNFNADGIVIVNTNEYGNVCEVKYHVGNPQAVEQIVLKRQGGQWFVSSLYTASLHRKLQQDCAGKLQSLAAALSNFAMINAGRYPSGNDVYGWEELRSQSLIKNNDAYLCPQDGSAYNYIGGKSTSADPSAPLAWCVKHREGDILSNVLLVNGKVTAMQSPMAYVPAMVPVAPAAPAAPAIPGGEGADIFSGAMPSNPPAAAVQTPDVPKTPADWIKGPDENWYVHYDDALAAARRENKKILLLHTGSDWCGWCKRLANDVLSQEEFKNYARNNLILLYFDSPSRRHPMSAGQREHVKQVERKLKVSGGYPNTFIFDANEQLVGRIGGYKKLDAYLDTLKKLVGDRGAGSASVVSVNPPASGSASRVVSAPASAPSPADGGWISVSRSRDAVNTSSAVRRSVDTAVRNNAKTVAPAHWLKGPTPDWYIHLEDAKAAAKRTGRKIYALHTGSDWCPPCKYLEKNILSTGKFQKFARENIILLFVDSPRRKPIPDDQRRYNQQLAGNLNFGGGVPSILLLDADGNPLKRIEGRRDVNTHIDAIRNALK